MENNNHLNGEYGLPQKPVAKVASVKKEKAETEANIFSEIYNQQKKDNEQNEPQADKMPIVSTVIADENIEQSEKNKKFKILFIFLIIMILAVFSASCLKLFLGKKEPPAEIPEQNKTVTPNTLSAGLVSPFSHQQTYKVDFPDGMQKKYEALYAQNTDFVGWLTVPNTCIDTPVYKKNNNSYYLKHDNYGTYTKYGIPFLDEENTVKDLSRNTVIYGHNFGNKLIFDELHNYQELDFYKENPVIEFNTLYKDYKWKVIAAFHTNGDSDGDNGYLFYYVATRMGNNNFMDFCDELKQRSYIHTGVDIQPTDKILTLSTCTYFFDTNGAVRNARFAVIARMVRDGESEDVDTSLAQKNENVRYPQLYYTAYGGSNPYKNASKWVPGSN